MAELEAAKQALGLLPGGEDAAPAAQPATPPADSAWSVPSHLLTRPALRGAAQRAADSGAAAAAQPSDFAAVLQHGLHLQELASHLGAGDEADQQLLLHRACDVYGQANKLREGRAAVVLFNWAVALSDISRLARASNDGNEAAEFLGAAALKYAAALAVDPNNAQALNNWGLVLQDLAALSPPELRAALLPPAVSRFRAALALQPDAKLTSRFSYNLGTVLYAHACWLQDGAAAAAGGGKRDAAGARRAFADAAQYIMLAFALQPGVAVYEQSLAAVQRLLPLPYLRSGPLVVAAPGTAGTPEEAWVPAWFALDGQVLQSSRPPAAEAGRAPGAVPNLAIDLEDVADAQVCWDPSLPAGGAFWLGLKSRPAGEFFVAEDMEQAAGWVDAVRLLLLLRKTDARAEGLQSALIARRQRQ